MSQGDDLPERIPEIPHTHPGGDRVRFEDQGEHTGSIFGGSSADIEKSILSDTFINTRILNARIMAVATQKDALGGGPLTQLLLRLDNGVTLRIDAPMMEVSVE